MNSDKTLLSERLEAALSAREITPSALANAVSKLGIPGISLTRGAVHHWSKGGGMDAERLIAVCMVLRTSPAWLALGIGGMEGQIFDIPSQVPTDAEAKLLDLYARTAEDQRGTIMRVAELAASYGDTPNHGREGDH